MNFLGNSEYTVLMQPDLSDCKVRDVSPDEISEHINKARHKIAETVQGIKVFFVYFQKK
jgi:hypothetical protein